MKTMVPTTPMFWQKVSRAVRSRTAEECQLQHQDQLNQRIRKKVPTKKNQKKGAEKGDTIPRLCRETTYCNIPLISPPFNKAISLVTENPLQI